MTFNFKIGFQIVGFKQDTREGITSQQAGYPETEVGAALPGSVFVYKLCS